MVVTIIGGTLSYTLISLCGTLHVSHMPINVISTITSIHTYSVNIYMGQVT
jgi:hypothetical protein